MSGNTNHRILIVGSSIVWSLESIYQRAFIEMGVSIVDLFDTQLSRYLSQSNILARIVNRGVALGTARKIEQKFLQFLQRQGQNYDVIILFKGSEFSRQTLEKCRCLQPHLFWININPDDPFNIESPGSTNAKIIESLSFFDLYCIWSHKLVSMLREHGCAHVEYLPFAYDPYLHTPPTDKIPEFRHKSISFIGSWDRQREEILANLANYDLHIYGNGWNRIAPHSPLQKTKISNRVVFGRELAEIVASSEISLNLLRPQNYGSHNMRTFEIPAMSGLMLTTRSAEQQVIFPEQEAALMFSNVKELQETIEWVFANSIPACEIRYLGMENVKKHTYTERARQLLQAINDV